MYAFYVIELTYTSVATYTLSLSYLCFRKNRQMGFIFSCYSGVKKSQKKEKNLLFAQRKIAGRILSE